MFNPFCSVFVAQWIHRPLRRCVNGAASPPCTEVAIRALLQGSALCHPPELLAELVSGRAQPQISLLLLDSLVPHFCSCLWESVTPKQCAFCGEAESELQSSIFFLAYPLLITETSEIYPFPLISALPAPLPLIKVLPISPGPFFCSLPSVLFSA